MKDNNKISVVIVLPPFTEEYLQDIYLYYNHIIIISKRQSKHASHNIISALLYMHLNSETQKKQVLRRLAFLPILSESFINFFTYFSPHLQTPALSMEKERKKLNKRLAELDRLFSSLYEDKVMERITERNFEMMSGKYQKEQLEIEARLREVTETLNESYEKSQGIRDFLSLIRNYQGLKELNATVVNALIDKILVSEREKSADGTVKQEIKIYYKFIGFVGELHITPTKRWTALPPKNCMVCSVEYVPGSAISKYCPICAKKVQREKSNESKRRSREQKRMICIELSAKNDRLKMSAVRGGMGNHSGGMLVG